MINVALGPVRLTSVAELHAGSPRRPPLGTLAAATDEASERAKCSQRDVMQLLFNAPANGPRVSSSAKLGGFQLQTKVDQMGGGSGAALLPRVVSSGVPGSNVSKLRT